MNAILALEDGSIFKGRSFGINAERCGEVVFNTAMSGYQEIITDPSYKGQIVTMTYPLIGNYGVNREDMESRKPFLEAFVVREYSKAASNWRSSSSLADYLKGNDIMGIEGIDTRKLTLHIRKAGAMKAVASTVDLNEDRLIKKARESRGLMGVDLVKDVTIRKKYCWSSLKNRRFKVVVIDCGVKYNILRKLVDSGCEVIVMPAYVEAKDILKANPSGVLLSNGPGDPAAVKYLVEATRALLGKIPLFGICLGHQILGLALGGRTYKLKFGHHGSNHPVKDLRSGKIMITSQNHGFCVDRDSLNTREVEITHINLNDSTLEGMRHLKFPAFSVQFHPEASPGPHDSEYLFHEFTELMKRYA